MTRTRRSNAVCSMRSLLCLLFEMDGYVLISCYGDMRNRLTEAFEIHFGWAADRFIFNYVWTTIVPGGGTLKDQGHDVLWPVRSLQPPVDSVGQADDLAGGGVGSLRGCVMLRHLAGYLREQEAVREDESFPAGFTLEVQGICPPVLSGGPAQRAAALTLEIFLQCEGRKIGRAHV